MQTLDFVEKETLRRDLPPFKVGDTVAVHVKVREGDKERIQIFQGLVMGSITVAPNVILEMRGSAAMDVILNEGSKLELYGQVGGDVVNRGGMVVHNEGSIKGKIVE